MSGGGKFLEKAIEKLRQGKMLKVRECSICGCALFFEMHDEIIYFDPHCDCMRYRVERPQIQTLEDFKFYTDQKVIQKQWGLDECHIYQSDHEIEETKD